MVQLKLEEDLKKGEQLNKIPPLRLNKSKSKVAKSNKKLGVPKPLTFPT